MTLSRPYPTAVDENHQQIGLPGDLSQGKFRPGQVLNVPGPVDLFTQPSSGAPGPIPHKRSSAEVHHRTNHFYSINANGVFRYLYPLEFISLVLVFLHETKEVSIALPPESREIKPKATLKRLQVWPVGRA